jgi:hypothetical protein
MKKLIFCEIFLWFDVGETTKCKKSVADDPWRSLKKEEEVELRAFSRRE